MIQADINLCWANLGSILEYLFLPNNWQVFQRAAEIDLKEKNLVQLIDYINWRVYYKIGRVLEIAARSGR